MSESETTKQSLFSEFPPVSTEEWEGVIAKDLKGANYKEKLRWNTGEGLAPLPFYRREDLVDIERRGPIARSDENDNHWEICEAVFANDISSANAAGRNALDRGATALQFQLSLQRTEGMLGGDLGGIPIQNQHDFSELLKDIPLGDISIYFDSGMISPALLAMLWNEVHNRNIKADDIRASFLYDPFSFTLHHGQLPKTNYVSIKDDIKQITAFTNKNLPHVRPLGIDARAYHNAGGTIIQELAYGLSTASAFLSILTEAGFEVDEVARSLHFKFGIGSRYFLEIAKFRAARLLWKNLLKAYGGDPAVTECFIQGETSRWNKTLYDPYTNMLRTSTEGMSAAIAGCDSITVLPFDEHYRQPDSFSERIARNSQLILRDEAYLDKVIDPSAGSYYIENLTEEIGGKAWDLFRDIELEGGLMKAIENGTVQAAIGKSQQQRDHTIATRERIFVGTNQYPNPDDKMEEKIDSRYQTVSLVKSDKNFTLNGENLPKDLAKAFSKDAGIGDLVPELVGYGKHQLRTIKPYRGTQVFEELRLATEHNDYTPKVLMLPLGTRRMRKARSGFASNFFGCVGYDIEEPIGYDNIQEAVNAVQKYAPDIAVICGSDKEYRELVPEICKAVTKLEKRPQLVLAGYPKADVDTYKDAGIDEFIYTGSNVLETLKRFQQKLGIVKN
ncbi:MAG: methylmalonyl-CoA mutase family protein [Balneolaceae bacterium]|jgi:methylmalonyl-CoA mutase